MIATICPDRETLLRYSLGMLPEEQREPLDSHLDGCPDCQAMIVTLDDADDTAIGRLRMPLSGESVLNEPQLQDALAAAMGMPARVPDAPDMPEMLGEYRLIEELGRGGMGRVYKALHTKLDRVVAIKVLPRGRAGDDHATNRFAREMKAVGRFAHPNIVHAYDAREIDGTAVLIMELVDGLDLAEIVRRAGVPALAGNDRTPASAGVPALAGNDRPPAGAGVPALAGNDRPPAGAGVPALAGNDRTPAKAGTPALPVPEACELIRQTALALQCAHDHGLVHRDIKPSNIMLARSGEVKLLDLGLARFLAGDCPSFCIDKNGTVPFPAATEEMTGTGQAMGTAEYMAPEQASDSRTVDIRADIYSLGCTFYKLLTGRAPFSGPEYRTTLDKMNAHVQQPAPPIRQIVPEVPEQLAAVLDHMLAKDPSARFATPAEVAEAIAPFCTGADLVALLKRAESSPALLPEEDKNLPSPSGRGARGEDDILPSPSGRGAGGEGRRWKRFAGQIVALAVVGGFCLALGIMIRITKDGKTTTVEVPGGSNSRVGPDGSLDVTLPGAGVPALAGNIRPQPNGGTSVPQLSVLHLVNAKVQVVAQLLEQILSGDESQKLATGPIKITTDARVNSLLVQANQADLATIKKLVEILDANADGAAAPNAPPGASVPESTGPRKVAAIRPTIQSTPDYVETTGKIVKLDSSEGPGKYLQIEIDQATFTKMMQTAQKRNARRAGPDPFGNVRTSPKPSAINWASILNINYGYVTAGEKDFPHRAEAKSLTEHFDPNMPGATCIARIVKSDATAAPGMSVLVRLYTGTTHDNLVLPQRALDADLGKQIVYVVGAGNVVEPRIVVCGQPEGASRIQVTGLNRNDVVIAKSYEVKPGMAVKPDFIAGALQSPTPPIEFIQTELKDVAQWLEYVLRIPIHLDERGLSAAGIKPSVPVTANIRDVSLASALKLLLRNVGLTYVAEDDYILITALGQEANAPKPSGAGVPALAADNRSPAETGNPTPPEPGTAPPVVVNPTAELKALRGQWNVVRVEKGSAAETTWQPDDKDFLHEGVQFCFQDMGAEHSMLEIPRLGEGTFAQFTTSVGSSAAPKWIDLYESKFQIGGQPGTRMQLGGLFALGLYEINGDRLRLCLARYRSGGTQRPKGFAVEPLSGQVLLELERYRPSADEKKLQDSTPVLREIVLDGETVFANGQTVKSNTSRIVRGAKRPVNTPRMEADVFLSFSAHRCALYNAHLLALGFDRATMRSIPAYPLREVGKWQYVLDPAAQPKTMTFVATTPEKGKEELLGIYKLEGDQLTIAYHNGAPRPEKFESAAGSGVTLMVLQLQQSPGSRSGRRGGLGGVSADTPNSAAPLPTVRVTQPVVCNVCDYEEYSGRIEEGVVRMPFQSRQKVVKTDVKPGTAVHEGKLLAEMVPYEDPKLAEARLAWEDAKTQIPQGRDKREILPQGEMPGAEISSTKDGKYQAEIEALKAAKQEIERAERDAPHVKIVAPISGKFNAMRNFGGDIGTAAFYKSILLAVGPHALEGMLRQTLKTEIPFGWIEAPDSMIISFDVPEQTVLAHRRLPDRKPNWELSLPVVCALADDKGFPYRGKVVSVAEGIDSKTHTQRWQAVVPNKDGLFMPGMSVRVRVITSEPHKVMLVPWGGDKSGFDGHVFTVNDRNVAEGRKVKVGRRYDDYVALIDGLSADEWIIASTESSIAFQTGTEVKPERITTPPPPWAAISVPIAVSVARPVAREVSDYADYTGRIDNTLVTQVVAPVSGWVEKTSVKLGQSVKQGDLTAEMVPDQNQIKFDELWVQMRSAAAMLNLENQWPPLNDPQAVRQRKASAEDKAKTAREAYEAALSKAKHIKVLAPCAGKVVSEPSAPFSVVAGKSIYAIISLDKFYAVFDVDERTVVQLRRRMADRLHDWELSRTVLCGLNGDAGFPLHGKVTSVDNEMDPKTGTQCWHALLPNKDGVLLPGMFVRVRLLTSDPHKVLLVPERALGSDAVGRDPGQKFVLVVNGQSAVERRDVEIGQLQDDGLRVVAKGLGGDDRVVLDPSKVTAGMAVKPEEPAAVPAGR